MVQVLLGLMLKWYYVQMTLQCYVFVEDWMSSNRGGARKKLWKLLFAEFFDYSIFVYNSFVGKEWINKCCGEKKLKFLLWFCTHLLNYLALLLEMNKKSCTPYFSDAGWLCYYENV